MQGAHVSIDKTPILHIKRYHGKIKKNKNINFLFTL